MSTSHASTNRATDSESDGEEVKKLRRELETAKAQLERIKRPLEQDVLSSTVNAEIKPGETLVTGGYRMADGNYELTLWTPRSVTLEDGSEAIELDGHILSAGSEFVEAQGLNSLATNARNTLQHAEAWMQDDVERILAAARDDEGASVLFIPKVTVKSSVLGGLTLTESDGAEFSLDLSVARSPNGSFAIQSRVERTPKAEQNGGGQPTNLPVEPKRAVK